MQKQNVSGFGVIEIIIGIIVVAAIIMGGIYIYNSNKQSPSTNPQADTPTQQTQSSQDPNEGYIVVSEWGVRLKPTAATADTLYTVSDNKLYLTTAVYLEKTNGDCKADGSTGQLVRGVAGYDYNWFGSKIEENSSAIKIGDYYYLWQPTDAPCTEPTQANIEIMNQYGPALEELARSVESVPAQ
ncbi:MAG TPA: hypothetical protein VLA77_02485 [Candidatus Saccharimonadales bacterium]|nr:hypothetical protein [Candidatus Saccharimonadales bacterium]